MPFVATSVDQLRVGDEVSVTAFDRYGEALGNLHFSGQITEIRSRHEILVMEHGDPFPTNYVFDGPIGRTHKRTWNVLSRDLEPASSLRSVAEDVTPRPGDRIALVRRREGVVQEVGDDHVRFEGGGLYSSKEALSYPWDNWTQTIEIIERAPEPLTDAEKLAAIADLLEECGLSGTMLAAKIADVLK